MITNNVYERQNIKKELQLISHQMKKTHPTWEMTVKNGIKHICILEKEISSLKKENSELKKENKTTKFENDTLKQIVKDFQDKESIDSHNSSKPPSTDNVKIKIKSLREKTGKKKGGQKGHKGITLELSPNPNKIINVDPNICECCGKDLSNIKSNKTIRRQVYDIPPILVQIIEYRINEKKCGCGHINQGKAPKNITNSVQYGENLKALIAYMNNYHIIPYKRTKKFLSVLLKHDISLGTIFNINKELYHLLEPWEKNTKNKLVNSPVGHSDESGIKGFVEGIVKKKWLHVFSTSDLTYYTIHKSRGKKAIEDMNIIPNFNGTLVHDFFSTYLSYDNCIHAFCNQHILRDLQRVIDTSYWEKKWAKKMKNHLYYIKSVVDRAKAKGKTQLDDSTIKRLSDRYDKILKEGKKCYNIPSIKGLITKDKNKSSIHIPLIDDELPPPPKVKNKKKKEKKQSFGKNLYDRLLKYKDPILLFMYDFNVPFTNNQAETDIRMIKLKQKISGCFRSVSGEKYFCCARSFISTMIKQDLNIFEYLSKVFDKSLVFS